MIDDKWGTGDDAEKKVQEDREREAEFQRTIGEASREINAAQQEQPGPLDKHLSDEVPLERPQLDKNGAMINGGTMAPGETARLLRESSDKIQADKSRRHYDERAEHFAEAPVGGDMDSITPEQARLDSGYLEIVPQVFVCRAPGNPITIDECMDFLQLYRSHGIWNHCAYLLGRSGKAFRDKAREDPIFARMVAEAVQDFRESLEAEIIRRGKHGTLEPVFGGKEGLQVGWVRKYSDMLLKFEMEAVWPERYRPNHKFSVDLTTAQQTGVMVVPGVAKSIEEWKDALANRPPSVSLERVTRKIGGPAKPEGRDG